MGQKFAFKENAPRPIKEIAKDIRKNWNKENSGTQLSPHAKPYLEAMEELNNINDNYYQDSGYGIVAYFLANAQTWKGDVAREIKAELNWQLKRTEGVV